MLQMLLQESWGKRFPQSSAATLRDVDHVVQRRNLLKYLQTLIQRLQTIAVHNYTSRGQENGVPLRYVCLKKN